MNAQEMIGLCRTADAKFAKRWVDICIKAEQDEKDWVAALRVQGVKASHPNDGWVNREKNEVQFVYPQFNDGVCIGDIVALGWPSDSPENIRFVKLVAVQEGLLGNSYWKFKDVEDAKC